MVSTDERAQDGEGGCCSKDALRLRLGFAERWSSLCAWANFPMSLSLSAPPFPSIPPSSPSSKGEVSIPLGLAEGTN